MAEQTVHLFVFDTLADWEYGYTVAGLQNAPHAYQIKTVATSNAPVCTNGGITILPDMVLSELQPEQSAMLILPGGEIWDQGGNSEIIASVQRFLDAGVPVAAICGATAGLARAGMLDNVSHTSNHRDYLAATNYRGAAFYQEQPAVTDGNIITANSTAALEFAREIFMKLNAYPSEVLDAWYGLFKTGDPAYYAQLMAAQYTEEK